MKSAKFSHTVAAALLLSSTLLADGAAAQPLEGEWTNEPSYCGQPYSVNNGNIHISANGYQVLESGCEFTGGTKVSEQHWVMQGVCFGEGPDSTTPEIPIELSSSNGQLTVDEDGRKSTYAMKCGAAP